MLSKYFLIGEITKPQGVRGELRMRSYSDDAKNLLSIKKIYTKSQNEYSCIQVESIKAHGDFFIIKLQNINSRDDAEKLRGTEIYIDRENASPLKNGEFYISDAIGAEVQNSKGEKIGILKDILTEYQRYVYVLNTPDGDIMFPAIPEVFLHENLEDGLLTLDEEVLSSIGVKQE